MKELVVMLGPLLKELGGSKKLFLTPLARYWAAPCCGDPQHGALPHTAGQLLGGAVLW